MGVAQIVVPCGIHPGDLACRIPNKHHTQIGAGFVVSIHINTIKNKICYNITTMNILNNINISYNIATSNILNNINISYNITV